MVPRWRRAVLGGARVHGPRRLPQEPLLRRKGRATRDVGVRVQRRPARRRRRSRHLLPGQHGSRRDVGPRPRGAHRRRHRPRDPSHRCGPLRRRLRERAPPPGVGTGTGDLRRGSASRRRDGSSADSRHSAPHDGLREALRVQLDGERAVQGRHRGRRGRVARGLPPSLQAGRRRGRRRRHERVQQRERRVLRRQQTSPHGHPARRVGLSGLRDQRLDLRHPRRRSLGRGRARRRDAVSHGASRWPA